uniref:Uncharacterized protein n=1 Tax=Kwoniella dejecticola CBS 10117 TaxID=1296121 RepID=A0A1A6A1U2_9TREE|nr:uncharacterized protein I303_06307 [Kwoniella dejecticola CBS 10117]OBR84020.1 hypothetical protein I303_06307 [Kwoniella dejecticola CBS 10117]
MANQQDRKKPRALTIPEMWISWDLMLDNPVPQSRLLDGTLGKDSLPSAALNEERGHS